MESFNRLAFFQIHHFISVALWDLMFFPIKDKNKSKAIVMADVSHSEECTKDKCTL